MKFHESGKNIILVSCLMLIAALLSAWLTGHLLLRILGLGLFFWVAFVFYFFRNPARPLRPDPEIIISPADGKIVIVEKVFEPEYLKEERWQVSVFMSPANVHANRFPISGTVEYYKYHPGKYLVAWHPKSSTLNERNTIVIRTDSGARLLVRQIAGIMARRIVCNIREGASVVQGEELGFIKFGSRVDLFLPLDADILVQKGQVVKGNIDRIARWEKI